MRLLSIALACSLVLSACATAPLVPPSASLPVAEAGTSLDAAYNLAAQAYISQLPNLSASTKATLKPLFAQAYQYVAAADAAEVLGQAATLTAQIGAAMALIGQIDGILGVKPPPTSN